ncbi:MAG: hypothetical protein ACLPSH_09755 [Vulcanimicrobiaceae bacterium]
MKRSALIAALLTAAFAASPLAVLADTSWGHGGSYDNGGGYYAGARTSGTIAETRGSMLRLQDGRPIYMHRGTIINPAGVALRPGMRISVSGSTNSDGGINAEVIDVGRGDHDWDHDRNWNGNGNWNGNPYNNR